jgi:hypothetical protein
MSVVTSDGYFLGDWYYLKTFGYVSLMPVLHHLVVRIFLLENMYKAMSK